jgi:hypothetical protein
MGSGRSFRRKNPFLDPRQIVEKGGLETSRETTGQDFFQRLSD